MRVSARIAASPLKEPLLFANPNGAVISEVCAYFRRACGAKRA
jgi:hypothetical protein